MIIQNTEFILILLFIKYCIIFHMNNCKPTFAPPCIKVLYIWGGHTVMFCNFFIKYTSLLTFYSLNHIFWWIEVSILISSIYFNCLFLMISTLSNILLRNICLPPYLWSYYTMLSSGCLIIVPFIFKSPYNPSTIYCSYCMW